MLVVTISGTVGPSRFRRSNKFFSDTVLHLESGIFRVHPSRASVAFEAHSSVCDVVSTYGTVVLCRRAWVRMNIAQHLWEH